jgi:hypothetical protein
MAQEYHINDTAHYHREELNTLGWELTVTNALETASSPCRSVLKKPGSFGELLFDHLDTFIPLNTLSTVAEIGGGYGFLMRDFLRRGSFTRTAMIDLSPVLLKKQRESLKDFGISFWENDFFSIDASFFNDFDLVILNEIVGDFPTICEISPDILTYAYGDPVAVKISRFFQNYAFPVPERTFNLNIGAMEAVERLCSAGVRYIYLSEHSCEAPVPEEMKRKITITSTMNPERIPLMGHCEYTIRFSYLIRIAEQLGYRARRGQYRDFISVNYSDRVNFILTSHSQKDDHEIIRQFIEDLFKYEYVVLMRQD